MSNGSRKSDAGSRPSDEASRMLEANFAKQAEPGKRPAVTSPLPFGDGQRLRNGQLSSLSGAGSFTNSKY